MRWIALLLAGSAWAADIVPPVGLPADTKLVIGIQLRHILDSPLAQAVKSEMSGAAGMQFAGVDFLKDVDQAILATSGADQNSPALIVLSGRFHVKTSVSYHGVPVVEAPQKADQIVAVLDEATALAGDVAMVHAAIDRRGQGSPAASAEMLSRINDMSAHYDFWGMGDDLPKSEDASQMSSVSGFRFGAAVKDGLDLTAELHLRSAKDIEQMKSWLTMVQAMLVAQSSTSNFYLDFQGETMKLSVKVPQADFKKWIAMRTTGMSSTLVGQMGSLRLKSAEVLKPKPATTQIQTNERGDTVRVTLPGGRN